MKNKFLLFTFSLGCLIILNGCSKEEKEKSTFDKLTDGGTKNWVLLGETAASGVPTPLKQCELDNTLTFTSSNQLIVGYGAVRCQASEQPQPYEFILVSDALISFYNTATGFESTFALKEISDVHLVVTDSKGVTRSYVPQK